MAYQENNYSDITAQYRQILGREPSRAELEYYDKFLKEGGIGLQEIGQSIQSSPEYQNKLLDQNTQKYGEQLGQYDQQILNQAGDTINSKFAGLGRPVSSGRVGALAQTAQGLAQQRQSQLAAFYGQGLSNNAGLGVQQGQDALARGYGLRDEARQRGYQIDDMNRYKDMYETYMNRQGRAQKNGAIGQLAGTALGAGVGFAATGTPQGAQLGAQYGSAFGYNAGGLFQK